MGSRLLNISIIWISLLQFSIAASGPLDLKVVYPKQGQYLPPVDSTFIFGSVTPGSDLTINGQTIEVHKEGGWLAFLPVNPGEFSFNLQAGKDRLNDSLCLNVILPKLPEYEFDTLYIAENSLLPSGELWVIAGDKIDLGFNSLPYCNAVAIIMPVNDTLFLQELPPRSYFIGKNVFEDSADNSDDPPGKHLIRGEYRGSYIIPELDLDSLYVIYQIYAPSAAQAIWTIEHGDRVTEPSMLPFHKLMSLPPPSPETSAVHIKILDKEALPKIELKDSLTVVRTGPGKGYLCIHQPAGIKSQVSGKIENWLKIKLSDFQYGWVPDTSVTFLSDKSIIPHSYVRKITTESQREHVTIKIDTQGKHPFRVIENLEEKSITLFVYGTDADTDWIRYDRRDEMIDHIIWFQHERGIYGIKIYLKSDRIWGYDGLYVDNTLHFDIKKPPQKPNSFSSYRFIIDPGHSPDPGAVGPTGLTEAKANLAIALQLKKELKRNGSEVILTRDDDSPLPLYDRPIIAIREKGDIFISIHNNALPDGTNPFVNNGVSTYYYHPHSIPLAKTVQEALVDNIGLNDFGLYYGNFAVSRPTQYPAILVECAFMMIPEQEAMLKTKRFQKKIARAIVEGIKNYIRNY